VPTFVVGALKYILYKQSQGAIVITYEETQAFPEPFFVLLYHSDILSFTDFAFYSTITLLFSFFSLSSPNYL